jgi:KaiC/GvpD/RAD55 family RecA-like ATPase
MALQNDPPKDRLSTGIPELDELIEGGIPKAFYLDIHEARRGLGARLLLWKLVCNFLKGDLVCIYVCLDFPSDEVRDRFKEVKFEPNQYEDTGNLIFLDFFTAKAKKFEAMMPSQLSTLEKLAYDPEEIITELVDTIPRLKRFDERGIIVVDSISSILADVKLEDANKFIRGIKMLTRSHKLVGISASYGFGIDPHALDMLHASADGCIRIDDGVLWVERFSRTAYSSEKLRLERTKEGILISKKPLP